MHHLSNGTQFSYNGISVTPSTAINEGLEADYDNIMTRMISGVTNEVVPPGRVSDSELDLAIYNIRNYFSFIGEYSRVASDFES